MLLDYIHTLARRDGRFRSPSWISFASSQVYNLLIVRPLIYTTVRALDWQQWQNVALEASQLGSPSPRVVSFLSAASRALCTLSACIGSDLQ